MSLYAPNIHIPDEPPPCALCGEPAYTCVYLTSKEVGYNTSQAYAAVWLCERCDSMGARTAAQAAIVRGGEH